MIKIRYEHYWVDYQNNYYKEYKEKCFSDLTELEEWIFGQMRQNYTDDKYTMIFPTPEEAERTDRKGPWSITFKPVQFKEQIWIHIIYSSDGIIFSDGEFTLKQKHWSKEMQDWLRHCKKRRLFPEFNFVE